MKSRQRRQSVVGFLVPRVGLTDGQPSKRRRSAGLVPFDLVDPALQGLEGPGAEGLVAVVQVIVGQDVDGGGRAGSGLR